MKLATKQQKIRKLVKDELVDNNLDKGFYFIQIKLGLFIAILANLLLSELWIWDTGTF